VKHAVTITAAALAVVWCYGRGLATDPVKSGPQIGETVPGPFHPLNVLNAELPENNGKKVCLYCQHGMHPVAMIFTREVNETVTALIQKLDPAVAANKDAKLGAFVVVLTDDERATEPSLATLVQSKGVGHVSLTIDNPAGPPKYNVAKDAEVTIVLYNHHKVIANHAFRKGEFTLQAVEAVIGELPKLLADD
jgi:hypothetical protein